MPKRPIHIIDFSPEVAKLQADTIAEISRLIPHAQVEAIGSFAVPLAGKEEIDIMIISKDILADSELLVQGGYRQGPIDDLSHLGKRVGVFRIDTHVVPEGHKMIGIYRGIIEKLKMISLSAMHTKP